MSGSTHTVPSNGGSACADKGRAHRRTRGSGECSHELRRMQTRSLTLPRAREGMGVIHVVVGSTGSRGATTMTRPKRDARGGPEFFMQKSLDGPMASRRPTGPMDETEYLLSSPTNAARLREAIQELKATGGTIRDISE